MRKIDEIIIHCTATVEGKDYHVADVDKWHKARGWKGIGYHYLITLDGTIEKGRKEDGDPALRPCFEKPQWTDLTDLISKLSEIKKNSPALNYGSFRSVHLTNHQCIFERKWEGDGAGTEGCREKKNYERILVAINAADYEYTAHFDAGCGQAVDLLTGNLHDFGGGSVLPPYSCAIWKMEN